MKLATIKLDMTETTGIVTATGIIPIKNINRQFRKSWETNLHEIINLGQIDEITTWHYSIKKGNENLNDLEIPLSEIKYGPLYRHPRKIWGIGLNNKEHAND